METQNAPGMPSPVPMAKTSLPKASELFSQAWDIYKNHFGSLIGITFIPILAILLVGMLVGGGAIISIKLNISQALLIPLIVVFVVALIYVFVWGQAALIQALMDKDSGISVKESYTKSRVKIWPLFLVGVLTGLAVLGGLILLIVPGIIFAIWFSQSSYIVMDGSATGTSALKLSKTYVNGRMGEVFLKFLFIMVITIGLNIVVGLFNSEVLINVFSWLWTPLTVAYSFLLYKNLKSTI